MTIETKYNIWDEVWVNDLGKPHQFNVEFYKQYPIEFKEPQLTCGKSWIPFNIYLNYQLMGLKIGAFKYKQSNREKKKRQQVLEQYKNWENKFKEYYEKPNQQTI